MKKLAIAGIAIVLASCSSEKSGTFETDEGKGSYTVDQTSGETSATITTEDGTVTMRSGENVAVDLPKGFTLYPGAKVISNTVIAQDDGKGALVVMESEASPQDMSDFYKKQAEAAGVDISIQLSTDEGRMIAGQAADGSSFSFNANAEDGKTVSQLTVQHGMSN
ncbi:MAG: hypothetical protein R3E18_01440 [Sphingomonadaceae bacterium]